MSKKFALCFSGYPRFVRKSFQTIKENLLDQLDRDFDIYASFQWDDNLRSKPIHHEFNSVFTGGELEDFYELYSDFNLKYVDVYKPWQPKDFPCEQLVSSEPDLQINPEQAMDIFFRLKSQYIGIADCIKMVNPKDYQYVIRLRTDLIFHKPLNIKNLDTNFLLNQTGLVAGGDRFFSDWFFICPTDKLDFFQDLSKLEQHFENGIIHMHKLVEKVGSKYLILPEQFYVDTPSTLKNPREYFS